MAAAQVTEEGNLVGTVVNRASGEVTPLARIYVEALGETVADPSGVFSFGPLPAGSHRIAAVGRGCFIALGLVNVAPGGTTRVDLSVISPDLAGIPSTPIQWEKLPGVSGSPWKVIVSADIQISGATDLLQILQAEVPQLVGRQEDPFGRSNIRSSRGNNSVVGGNFPIVILDGVRLGQRPEIALQQIAPGTIARIEIFKGPAGAWIHGSGGAGGVIRVLLKRFHINIDPQTPADRCGNPFSSGSG